MALFKSRPCASETSAQTGSRHSNTFKKTLAVMITAVILILIVAMLRHSVATPDGTGTPESIGMIAPDRALGIQGLRDRTVRSEGAVQRVSAPAQSRNLDPLGLLFDLKNVVGQTPEAVARVLGETPVLWPDERTPIGALRGKYRRGKVEIGYAGEAARFVTIRLSECKRWKASGMNSRRCVEADDFTGYKFRQNVPDLLQALGLPQEQRPSLSNTSVLMWNGASGIHQVSVTPNDLGGIDYIHVISSRVYACLLQRTELECQPS